MIPAPLKEIDFLKAFALLMVCSVIGGALSGGILGASVGAIAATFGASMESIQSWASILGALSGVIVSYFFFRWLVLRFIVRKLALVTTEGAASAI